MSSSCIICMNNYNNKRLKKISLKCKHDFCKECLLECFKSDNRCPLCRKEFELIFSEKNRDFINIINKIFNIEYLYIDKTYINYNKQLLITIIFFMILWLFFEIVFSIL